MSSTTDLPKITHWSAPSFLHGTLGVLAALVFLFAGGCASRTRIDTASAVPTTNSDKPNWGAAYVTLALNDTATEWEFVPWLRVGGVHVEKDANGDDRIFNSPACRAILVRYRRMLHVRLEVIAENLTNENCTRDAQGAKIPYRRRFVVASAGGTFEIRQDPSPFLKRYVPGSPDADSKGYVQYPNVDPAVEEVNALRVAYSDRVVTRILMRFDPSFIDTDGGGTIDMSNDSSPTTSGLGFEAVTPVRP